jgi:4-carboxymuconolactone decarboxylase
MVCSAPGNHRRSCKEVRLVPLDYSIGCVTCAVCRAWQALGQFVAFQAAEEQNTSLTPRQRQVVILAVGAMWHSAYELYAHSAAARTAGLPADTVRALAAGQLPGDLSAAEQAAWRFAGQLTADRRVLQPVYDQAQAAFSTRGIADMLCLIGAYQTVCGILNAFEIPAPQTSQAR